ncbi:MAG TPA: type II secretion system F family protein [Candidatus Absconditabacterales bacterium]|nr:type II secretion system F family protein [Candidatus Absconditabacterales bacterium]
MAISLVKKTSLKADFFEKLVIKLQSPGLKHKTVFFRLLAVAQKAGLGVRESLFSILKSERNSALKMIISDLIKQLTQGLSLAESLRNHGYFFSSEEIELVKAAELTGTMPETLDSIARELENYQKIIARIRSALTYPAVLIVFTLIAVIILLTAVVPTIVSLFPDKTALPAVTLFMIGASDFMISYWYLVLGTVFLLVSAFSFLYKHFLPFTIFIDKLTISLPFLSDAVKTFYQYRFSKLLSNFYKAGVSPIIALEQMSNIFDNYWYKKKMIEIKGDLEAGFGFSDSMEGSDLFDPLLVQIIMVGENTGNIADVLATMGRFYRDIFRSKVDMLMSFIEPFLMAFIALIVGGIMASIFLPMADLVNVIGKSF